MNELFSIPSSLEITTFDTALPGNPLLVSRNGKHYQIGGVAKKVLLSLGTEEQEIAQISENICARHGYACPPEQIRETLDRFVALSIAQSSTRPPAARKSSRWAWLVHGYFALRIPLLQPAWIAPITSRMAALFSPVWMLRVLPALLAGQVAFCWFYFHAMAGALRGMHGWIFALLLAGNYAGLLLHELGHASACIRCGIRHGPIGFGVYLFLPAFYADVSEAWRLPRHSRMVVDAAGMYISLLGATLCSALFLALREPALGVLAVLYDITVLLNLNPFIRMDGYWLLSDALGVQQLMATNRSVSVWLLRSLLRRPLGRPLILTISPRLQRIYFCYYVLFLGFSAWLSFRLLWLYLPRLIVRYPMLWKTAFLDAASHGVSLHTLESGFQIALATAPLAALSIYGSRIVRDRARLIRSLARREPPQPKVASEA